MDEMKAQSIKKCKQYSNRTPFFILKGYSLQKRQENLKFVKSAFCAGTYAWAQNADFADFSQLIHSQVKFDDVD